jgi:hypothetical protein
MVPYLWAFVGNKFQLLLFFFGALLGIKPSKLYPQCGFYFFYKISLWIINVWINKEAKSGNYYKRMFETWIIVETYVRLPVN